MKLKTKCQMIKTPNLNTFYRFLRTFQLLRKIFVTLFISYVFFLNFAREIGARPAKIDPFTHARRCNGHKGRVETLGKSRTRRTPISRAKFNGNRIVNY